MILHEPNPWALLSFATVQAAAAARDLVPQRRRAAGAAVRLVLRAARAARLPRARADPRVVAGARPSTPASLQPYRDRVTRHSVRHRRRALAADRRMSRGVPTRSAARPAGRSCSSPAVTCPTRASTSCCEAAAPLDVHVVILGDGPMRAAWTALARRRPVTARVSFHGEVDDDELRAQLAACRDARAAVGDAGRGVRLRAARGDGLRQAGDQHALPTGVPWVNRDRTWSCRRATPPRCARRSTGSPPTPRSRRGSAPPARRARAPSSRSSDAWAIDCVDACATESAGLPP